MRFTARRTIDLHVRRWVVVFSAWLLVALGLGLQSGGDLGAAEQPAAAAA
jgi:hypothetical protein